MPQQTHLPEPLTSLVGREPEVRRIVDLLGRPETRHLTLCGAGGIGKTRLALRVGQSVGDDFPDGVSFIDLSPVTDPALVATTIGHGLGLTLAGPEPVLDALAAHFADLSALLILDNFEHLMPAATVVPHLALACPDLAILVTSRERLGTSGERVLTIDPLALPDPDTSTTAARVSGSPAVRLFVERATAAQPGFALTDENATDVATICRRVDGMPLGIELVAARVAHLSPKAIATNVEHLLPLMAGSAPDLPVRLRTMSDAVRWSYDLLEPEEQALFHRLSVFAGGCTIEAATEVCIRRFEAGDAGDGQPLDAPASDIATILRLASLVDKSLLRFNDRDGTGSRYTMLEPVREFGLSQLAALDQEAETRLAHAEYFLAFAERLRVELREPEPGVWISHLEAEQNNFRAALHWLLESDQGKPTLALRICNELAHFWLLRGREVEARVWLPRAVAQAGDVDSYDVAGAHFLLGHFSQNDASEAIRYYQRSLRIFRGLGHQGGISGSLSCLGNVAAEMGNYAEASAYLEESLRYYQQIDDPAGTGQVSADLGILMGRIGRYKEAKAYLDTARGLREQLGDVSYIAFDIMELGRVYRLEGRLDEATDLLEWSLARLEQTNISLGQGAIHCELGEVALLRQDLLLAIDHFQTGLRLLQEARSVDVRFADAVAGLARVLLRLQKPELTVQALTAIEAWLTATGFRAPPHEETSRAQALAVARRALGEQRFILARERGRRSSLLAAADLMNQIEVPVAAPKTIVPQRALASVGHLTRQEQRVLCLIASGLSNQQIADSLSITIRTAANHVTNILGKFSVENRTQAAAIAMRHDFCPPNQIVGC
ncbi:MAG: tetratricopeptide repeat protein [Chloroflexia bacterium]|nr:tetratricopeptide repeat protein [Chloroflexia bacterium]MDQ3412725.1 tetratricopeptide repeat protein [Chloroflexota bacterium]